MVVYGRAVVYRQKLSAMYQTGGQADRWARRLAQRMEAAAIIMAPVRSGDLKRQHTVRRRGINQWAANYQVWNDSDHAQHVHFGTTGPIRPKTASKLRVPNRGGAGYRLLPSVRGQKANPWLDRACSAVAGSAGAFEFF